MKLYNIIMLLLPATTCTMQQQLSTQIMMIRLYLTKKTTVENIIDFLIRNSPNTSGLPSISPELINIQNDHGISLLHAAVLLKDQFFIDWLLRYNANVNIQNNDGDTPLHMAIREKNIALVKKLIEHNADVLIQNNKNETARMIINRLKTNAYAIQNASNIQERYNSNARLYAAIEHLLARAELKKNKNDENENCVIL